MAYHHGNLREALLERAAEVIAADGVEGLSLRALARDLGVSHAAPQRHFPDRASLLAELAKEGFRRSMEALERGAEAAGADPVARYRAFGRAYVQFALDHPSYFRAINHPEVQHSADEELRQARQDWASTLRRGVEAARAGGWHPEQDVATLLTFSCAAAIGAAGMLSDPVWRKDLGVSDTDNLADLVLDLVVQRTTAPAATPSRPRPVRAQGNTSTTTRSTPRNPRKRRSA